MLGAIYGDIVGSRFEFQGFKSKKFELFTNLSTFTDDSLMTLAIAKTLLFESLDDIDMLKRMAIINMVEIFKKYPNTSWGSKFYEWLNGFKTPLNSFGNGAAMRISPVGWIANSIDEVKAYSKALTEISHNHPEGLKGAEALAVSVYLARVGKTKEEIKNFIGNNYYSEVLTLDFEWLRNNYGFVDKTSEFGFDKKYVTCQGSVPQAIVAFLASTDFEDAIRNAISLGGDSDTLACMCGAIAEAYYGMTLEQEYDVLDRLPDDLAGICYSFKSKKAIKIIR